MTCGTASTSCDHLNLEGRLAKSEYERKQRLRDRECELARREQELAKRQNNLLCKLKRYSKEMAVIESLQKRVIRQLNQVSQINKRCCCRNGTGKCSRIGQCKIQAQKGCKAIYKCLNDAAHAKPMRCMPFQPDCYKNDDCTNLAYGRRPVFCPHYSKPCYSSTPDLRHLLLLMSSGIICLPCLLCCLLFKCCCYSCCH